MYKVQGRVCSGVDCRRRNRGGFTLTELLIVMAILVLLVSLIGPRLLGSKQKADINAVKTQIGMLQSALEKFAVDMNRFPASEEGLQALITPPSGDTGGMSSGSGELGAATSGSDSFSDGSQSGSSNWDGPYLKTETLPRDPWGKPYGYAYPPTHNKINVPDIWSFGPDGVENTEDDIVSWNASASGSSESRVSQ